MFVMFMFDLLTDGKPKNPKKNPNQFIVFIEINLFYFWTKITFKFNVL